MDQDKPVAKGERREEQDTLKNTVKETVGSHPIAAGAGAAAGMAAGAVAGIAAGPVGSLFGAAAGAAMGAMGGTVSGTGPQVEGPADGSRLAHGGGVAEAPPELPPHHRATAISYGEEIHARYGPGASWTDIEPSLESDWEDRHGASGLSWNQARFAVREGWQRLKDAS